MICQKGSNLFNVAIYIRLSREDGDKEESDSVGNQRKLLTEYVNKHDDFILYDVYIDDGFTGTNFNRPDFHRMIADIEDNKVNCVVVKDLSRFGRIFINHKFIFICRRFLITITCKSSDKFPCFLL